MLNELNNQDGPKLLNDFEKVFEITKGITINNVNEETFLELQTSSEKLFLFTQKMDFKNNSEIIDRVYNLLLNNPLLGVLFTTNLNENFIINYKNIVEKLFENYDFYKIICNVFKMFKEIETEKYFFIISHIQFINFSFKIPTLVSNLLGRQIVSIEYEENLLTELIQRDLIDQPTLEKIYSNKLFNKFLNCLKKLEVNSKNDIFTSLIETIHNSVFINDFASAMFQTTVKSNIEFSNISYLISKLQMQNDEFIGIINKKIMKILNNNIHYIPLLLDSGNHQLLSTFIKYIIEVFRNQGSLIEKFDEISFHLLCFSFFYFIEGLNNNDAILFLIQNVLTMFSKILPNVLSNHKRKTFVILNNYILKKSSQITNTVNEISPEQNEDPKFVLFEEMRDKLKLNPLYFIIFKEEYESQILKIKKIKNEKLNLIIDKKNEEEKKVNTKYISVKFQKKYGVYEKKRKNELLEISEEPLICIKKINNGNNLKIQLETEEDFSDLTPLNKPTHLKDCLLGISSEYPDRQKISLESLPSIISSQPLDLDFFLPSISEALLKCSDQFEIENFDNLICSSLIKLTIYDPKQMTLILCKRFFREECGLKQKFQILCVIEKSVEEISNYYQKPNSTKEKKPKENKLHIYFENIIFPLLHYLHKSSIKSLIVIEEYENLLSKFIVVIGKLIKFSENHPFIYKALFESIDLFKATSEAFKSKQKSLTLIDSLNYYSSCISKFLNRNFLEIYPEFLPNFKYILTFLNENFENITNNDVKTEMLKNINNYLIGINKLKESFDPDSIAKNGLFLI
jgi:hypothetical protein